MFFDIGQLPAVSNLTFKVAIFSLHEWLKVADIDDSYKLQ
jgi:hypothetical protein